MKFITDLHVSHSKKYLWPELAVEHAASDLTEIISYTLPKEEQNGTSGYA